MPSDDDDRDSDDASTPAGDAAPKVCVFSPSPLYGVTIESGAEDRPEVHFHAAGQGFWVARMVARLGARATFCAPLGGESGQVLETLVAREGVAMRAVAVEGWNGGYVHDRRGGERRALAEVPTPRLTRHEVDDLYSAAVAAGLAAGVAVLTGPMDPWVLPAHHVYRRLALDLGNNGVAVVADLSGEALLALEGGCRYVKVSHTELMEAGLAEGEAPAQLAAGAAALRERAGAEVVVVSRADLPALARIGDRLVEFEGPRFEALEHRGAGDSMTAGLAVGCARGLDPEATLRLAAAAGSLNVTRHGLGSGHGESIEAIARHVEVRPVDLG